jgi:hypothetical protein
MKIKTQKFSFSLLLCIFLAILTALSFVLSFSGAWFTSSKTVQTDNISLRFGSVRLGENFNSQTVANMVPTETIAYYGATTADNIVYNGTVDAYYRIKFDVTTNTLSGSAYTEDAYSETFEKLLDFNTTSESLAENNQLRDDWNIYGKVSQNGYIPQGTLRLSSETPNLFENKEFRVKVTIDLFQAQNINFIEGVEGIDDPDAEDEDLLLCYQNLFYYKDWGEVAETTGLDYTPNDTALDYSTNPTCYVSGIGSATPGSTLKIPQVVTIDGVEHKVTGIGKTDSGVNSGFWSNGIRDVILSPYVVDIGDYAFGTGGYYLKNVYMSPNVMTIGKRAFDGCRYYLNKCDIPSSVTTIGSFAFAGYRPKSLKLPPNVTIGQSAFNGAQNIIMIVFGEDSQRVRLSTEQTFSGCTSLLALNLPKNFGYTDNGSGTLTGFNARTIVGSVNLQSLTVNGQNATYYSSGNCIIRKSDNTVVCGCVNSIIPNTATSIDGQAFYNTSDSITIPYNVTSLNGGCFYYNSLTSLTLENPNISIATDAFGNNKNIQTINFNGTQSQFTWSKSIFLSGDRTLTVHCTNGDLIL